MDLFSVSGLRWIIILVKKYYAMERNVDTRLRSVEVTCLLQLLLILSLDDFGAIFSLLFAVYNGVILANFVFLVFCNDFFFALITFQCLENIVHCCYKATSIIATFHFFSLKSVFPSRFEKSKLANSIIVKITYFTRKKKVFWKTDHLVYQHSLSQINKQILFNQTSRFFSIVYSSSQRKLLNIESSLLLCCVYIRWSHLSC